jgi:opacity protein-like surface antigen
MLTRFGHLDKDVGQIHNCVTEMQHREHQMKKLLALAVLGALSTSAAAADLGGSMKDTYESAVAPCGSKTWTGFTLSVGIRADMMDIGQTSIANGADLSASVRDLGVEGHLAADYQFANSPLVLGGFGSIGYNGASTVIDESLGVIGGVAIGNVLPYALISAEFMDTKWSDFAGGTSSFGITSSGYGVGGGVKFRITNHLVAGVEYKRIYWGSVEGIDIKEDRIAARVGYQF